MAFKIKTLAFFILMLCLNTVEAHQVSYHNHLYKQAQIIGAEVDIADPRVDDPGLGINYFVTSRAVSVKLIYGREQKSDLAGDFWTYKVSYDLQGLDEFGNIVNAESQEISINKVDGQGVYETGNNGISFLVGTVSYRVVITGLEATDGEGGPTVTSLIEINSLVPNDIRLELQLDIEGYDLLDQNSTAGNIGADINTDNYQVDFYWEYIKGAESYELEWAYWDDETVDMPNLANEELIFKDAVRIETSKNQFEMPLTLPSGQIFYRVRPIGRYVNVGSDFSHRKNGAWRTYITPLTFTGFEDDKNWQYTTSFAEDGKFKKVINYFDEGLKSRQTLTNLSTEEVTLVATNHYDVEGRQTLSMLPVPALGNNTLFYKPKFNQSGTGPNLGDTYNRENFDKQGPADVVNDVANATNLGGAGHYFSANHIQNTLGTGIYKEYIPDAGGMPFTQVKYMNDGTGRPISQSGVGDFYQIGSDRETKYFYDDATSTQLKRLFGKNVGDATYYRRNLVMDANGQMSVSYIDQAGNVIATALAGTSPSNVDFLDADNDSLHDGLLDNETQSLNDNNVIYDNLGESVTSTMIMNEDAGGQPATFSYNFAGTNQSFSNADGSITFCASCDYELTVTATDPDGFPVTILPDGVFELYRTFSGSNDCTNPTYSPANVPIGFNINMTKVGNYKVVKKLKVIEKDIDDWVSIVETNNLIADISEYEAAIPIDYLNCAVNCDQIYLACEANILQANPNITPTELQIQIQDCADIHCPDLNDILANAAEFQCYGIEAQLENHIDVGGCYENLTAIEDHPEYCQLVYCENTVAERTFEYQFANAATWDDYLANLDPPISNVPMDWNNIITYVINNDPMFQTGVGFYDTYNDTNSPVSSAMQAEILAALNTNNLNSFGAIKTRFQNALDNIGPNDENIITYITSDPIFSNQWQIFIGLYLGEKYQLRNDIKEDWCSAGVGDCAVQVTDNNFMDTFSDIDDETTANAAAQNFIGQQLGASCLDICQGQVDTWVNEILAACPAASGSESQIKNELLEYCYEGCGLGNPLGYLIKDDLYNPIDPHLDIVKSILDGAGCDGLLVLGDASTVFGDVYEVVLDANGQPMMESQTLIHPCFVEYINIIGNHLQNNPNGNNYITGFTPPTCWVGNNPEIFIEQINDPLIQPNTTGGCPIVTFRLLDPQTNNPIQIYGNDYVTWMGNPIVNGNDIEVTIQKVNSLTTQQAIVDITNPTNQSSKSCLTITNTVTVVTPITETFTINLDDLYVDCVELQNDIAVLQAQIAYDNDMNTIISTLINEQECLNDIVENFTVTYSSTEHHYTLYYYDQSGNLVQTVPPIGLDNDFYDNAVDAFGNLNAGFDYPDHTQRTRYQYNSLGQVVWQSSPDGGDNRFKYDWAQRLRLSENAKQLAEGAFSFSRYDEIGRVIEVGELESTSVTFGAISDLELNNINFPNNTVGILHDITQTFYDDEAPTTNDQGTLYPTFTQSNLRNRVSMTKRFNQFNQENIATRYSYDEHGNITSLNHVIKFFEDQNGNIYAHQVDYDYDLISGNVKEVAYQAGKEDEFYHRYEYDADNRLTHTFTSENKVIWEKDARYFYYQHGPMARTELGNDKVQGQDHFYTLQGWIKGVNLTGENSHTFEMGRDGNNIASNINQNIARDAMAYGLNYHNNDYSPIGIAAGELGAGEWTYGLSNISNSLPQKDFNNVTHYGLFNGNIAMMVTDLKGIDYDNGSQAMVYNYDQLHRIKKATSFEFDIDGWQNNPNNQYLTTYSYDGNGNLDKLTRSRPFNGGVQVLDDLQYNYDIGLNDPFNPDYRPNRLLSVSENTGTSEGVANQGTSNYEYDEIGNLTSDLSEDIEEIFWDSYGKVERVTFLPSANKPDIHYTYDAAGNRLTKRMGAETGTEITYYVRDASGNVMSIYKRNIDNANISVFTQKEIPLYGSSRLGMMTYANKVLSMNNGGGNFTHERTRGHKFFELSNHLGNALTVITDQKLGVSNGSIADYYEAVVLSARDYYPFGMEMEGRTTSSDSYRYGFNGKENDKDWGTKFIQDYGFRLYNPSIARFLSVDPIRSDYPELTPYQFASNTPIWAIDLDGLEGLVTNDIRIIVNNDPSLKPGDVITIREGFSASQKGIKPKPKMEILPGHWAPRANMGDVKYVIDGVIVYDQYSNAAIKWFGQNSAQRRSKFHVEAQSLLGPDLIAKGVGALILSEKLLKASKAQLGKLGKAATSPKARALYRLAFHRLKGKTMDISLGVRNSIAIRARDTKSSYFGNFFINGFTQHEIALSGAMNKWLPGVAQAINTSIANGGRVFFHLDGLTDLKALWNVNSENFSKGTLTELRYLIDNNLLKHVDFFINGAKVLPEVLQKQLDEAIETYKKTDSFGTKNKMDTN